MNFIKLVESILNEGKHKKHLVNSQALPELVYTHIDMNGGWSYPNLYSTYDERDIHNWLHDNYGGIEPKIYKTDNFHDALKILLSLYKQTFPKADIGITQITQDLTQGLEHLVGTWKVLDCTTPQYKGNNGVLTIGVLIDPIQHIKHIYPDSSLNGLIDF